MVASADHDFPVRGHGVGRDQRSPGTRARQVLVVAQDGRPGHFASVQAAVDAVPAGRGPVTIIIEPGTYWGQVYVPASKPDLTLAGATGNPGDVTWSTTSRTARSRRTATSTAPTAAPPCRSPGTGSPPTASPCRTPSTPRRTRRSPHPRRWRSRRWPTGWCSPRDRLLGIQDTVFASSYADPFTPAECFAPGRPARHLPARAGQPAAVPAALRRRLHLRGRGLPVRVRHGRVRPGHDRHPRPSGRHGERAGHGAGAEVRVPDHAQPIVNSPATWPRAATTWAGPGSTPG